MASFVLRVNRQELLSMVRKHSDLLKKGVVDEQDELDVEMDQRLWSMMLDLYFVWSGYSRRRHDNDLAFFARKLIVKTVFASPNHLNFHPDSSKEVQSVHAYPNVSFAMDDLNNMFDAIENDLIHT